MNAHEKYIRMINAELDGEISQAEGAELKAHLADCEPCTAERENLRSVALAFGDAERLRVPARFNAAVMSALRGAGALRTAPRAVRPVWRWLGVAAAVAGVLPALGLTLLIGLPLLRYIREFAVWGIKSVGDSLINSVALVKASSALSNLTSTLGRVTYNLLDGVVSDAVLTHGVLVACVALAIGAYMLLAGRRSAAQTTT
ncbi:MAG: hypothetical protein GY771_06360 [bacterium]|nr:hypothetical protein [bacterium]